MSRSECFVVILLFVFNRSLISQESATQNDYKGKISGKIYSDFSYRINSPVRSTAFELERAYFGYERQVSENFFAYIKLDVGSPDDISEFSKLRRYAYFKNAGIMYKKGPITVWGGLFDMMQFKVQEKFWGYRYLYKSFMDEYRIGPSADLGAGIQYSFNKYFVTDLLFSNGEGYSSPQRDDTYKTGIGLTFTPVESLTIRTYYTFFMAETPQMTFSGFAGFNTLKFRIGGEYNHQLNYNFISDRDRYGYSVYGTYIISENWELFMRYDHLFSNLIENSEIPWNLPNDGSALIGGIQFTPVSSIHLSLDYQDWVQYAGNGEKEQIIYLHLEANF